MINFSRIMILARKYSSIRGLISFLFVFILLSVSTSQAQDSINTKKRIVALSATQTVGYVGSLLMLDQAWYADYERSEFHWFNDNDGWLQMDKVGHSCTAYYLSWLGYEMVKWTGVNENIAVWWGGASGFAYMTVIELLDGHSAAWGASPGDLIANTAGTAMFIGQQLAWKEQRVLLKFSHSPSPYAAYRPEALGYNYAEQLLKDYNAQSYWLSFNPASFLKKDGRLSFLNVALGYSGDGMLGGSANPNVNASGQVIPQFVRSREFYLSMDIDLSRIPVKNIWLKRSLKLLNLIKVPFPAIGFHTENGLMFKPLYF